MQTTSKPNSESSSVLIRGNGTLNDSSPLILVDGMEMPLNEIDTVIRACIQYVLAYDDVDVRINYIDFRNKLVSENLDDSVIGMIGISPYFSMNHLIDF